MAEPVKVGDHLLQRLTLAQMAELAHQEYLRIREKTLANCEEVGLGPDETMAELKELAKREDLAAELYMVVQRIPGAIKIIEKAAEGRGLPPVDDWDLSLEQLVEGGMRLIGLRVGESDPTAGNGQP